MSGPLRDAAGDAAGGGGGGAADQPDFAKQLADMQANFTKQLNDGLKKQAADFQKQRSDEAAARAKADEEARIKAEAEAKEKADEAAAAAASAGTKPDPQVAVFRRQLAELTAKNEATERKAAEAEKKAEEKDRISTLRSEIAKVGVQPDRIDAALRIFSPDVKRSADGSLVGSDDTPVADWLAFQIKQNEYLLPARTVNGAGATGGTGTKSAAMDIGEIKVGMKQEDMARASAEIARVVEAQLRGA